MHNGMNVMGTAKLFLAGIKAHFPSEGKMHAWYSKSCNNNQKHFLGADKHLITLLSAHSIRLPSQWASLCQLVQLSDLIKKACFVQ